MAQHFVAEVRCAYYLHFAEDEHYRQSLTKVADEVRSALSRSQCYVSSFSLTERYVYSEPVK